MLLPNAQNAYIPDEKLYDYCLSESHPVGKHKAVVFKEVLGIKMEEAEFLRKAILQAVLEQEAILQKTIKFGTLYIVDFELENEGKRAIVRSAWIIPNDDPRPRMTSCYIL